MCIFRIFRICPLICSSGRSPPTCSQLVDCQANPLAPDAQGEHLRDVLRATNGHASRKKNTTCTSLSDAGRSQSRTQACSSGASPTSPLVARNVASAAAHRGHTQAPTRPLLTPPTTTFRPIMTPPVTAGAAETRRPKPTLVSREENASSAAPPPAAAVSAASQRHSLHSRQVRDDKPAVVPASSDRHTGESPPRLHKSEHAADRAPCYTPRQAPRVQYRVCESLCEEAACTGLQGSTTRNQDNSAAPAPRASVVADPSGVVGANLRSQMAAAFLSRLRGEGGVENPHKEVGSGELVNVESFRAGAEERRPETSPTCINYGPIRGKANRLQHGSASAGAAAMTSASALLSPTSSAWHPRGVSGGVGGSSSGVNPTLGRMWGDLGGWGQESEADREGEVADFDA